MNKRTLPYIIIFALAALILIYQKCRDNAVETSADKSVNTKKTNRNRGFDRTISYLEYTQHALCRMDCRKISKNDIYDIMKTGTINYSKSNVKQSPCPIYAVQGYSNDNEHLRVIFAQCDNSTKVITCYNLDQEFECDCPGDEKK